MFDNDMMAQCSRRLIKVSKEEEQARINEIRECKHLFVKLKDIREGDNEQNTIVVECVHCGVTNKYRDLEKTLLKYQKSLDYYIITAFHRTDFEYNSATIETLMMNEIEQSGEKIELMSNDVIRTLHPGLLYQLAKQIKPDSTNEELFIIMKELNELESNREKNQLSNIDDTDELVQRYHIKKKTLL